MYRSRKAAFTLVELLVVIGIIALLISALLPALNTARQQANSIDCQARLRSMGQTLGIYLADSRGVMPWGAIGRGGAGSPSTFWVKFTPSTADSESTWWWYYTFNSLITRSKFVDNAGRVNSLSKVFYDRDTIEEFGESPNYRQHYTVNPKLMPFNGDADYTDQVFYGKAAVYGDAFRTLKASAIKTPNVFVIWDAPQAAVNPGSQPGNSYGVASALDRNRYTYSHTFVLQSPRAITYDRAVVPGEAPTDVEVPAVTKSLQIIYNKDLRHAFDRAQDGFASHLRFRHLKNRSLNALCMDGHVESRRVGEAMVTDFCINYPNR